MWLSALSMSLGTTTVDTSREWGRDTMRSATSTKGVRSLAEARKAKSFTDLGQASASIHIFKATPWLKKTLTPLGSCGKSIIPHNGAQV
jgi:hypothetical protein